MAISGETIDYGPCAFMDAYDPARSSARSTVTGATPTRTSPIAQWNLARLAETLLPLFDPRKAPAIERAMRPSGRSRALRGTGSSACAANSGWRRRKTTTRAGHRPSRVDAGGAADFTNTFRALTGAAWRPSLRDPGLRLDAAWQARLAREAAVPRGVARMQRTQSGHHPPQSPRGRRLTLPWRQRPGAARTAARRACNPFDPRARRASPNPPAALRTVHLLRHVKRRQHPLSGVPSRPSIP